MPSHSQVAARVREHKEAHPELYCADCLWMTGGGQCPRHGGPPHPSRNAANFAERLSQPPRGVPNPPTNRPNYTGD